MLRDSSTRTFVCASVVAAARWRSAVVVAIDRSVEAFSYADSSEVGGVAPAPSLSRGSVSLLQDGEGLGHALVGGSEAPRAELIAYDHGAVHSPPFATSSV